MIATIVTFITTRIVAVFITTIVVVAAVPSVIVLIHGNTITITAGPVASASRQHGDERTRLILVVKTAGDDALAKITSEEATCDSQIAQLAAQSTISATATQVEIDKGKSEVHLATAPFVKEIDADESEFSHLRVLSTTTEQTFLVRISQARVTAVSDDGTTGVVVTVCQTVLIEIRQVIITVVVQPGGEGDDGD